MKPKVTRKRFTLKSDEFEALQEVVVETTVEDHSLSARLLLPHYDRVVTLDFYVSGSHYFHPGDGSRVPEIPKDITKIVGDLRTLRDALLLIEDHFINNEEAFTERAAKEEAEALRKREERQEKARGDGY